MKNKRNKMSGCYSAKVTFKNRKGIALIITVGVLAMTVIIAVSFTMNMQLEQKIAVNYLNEVKAKYLAEAGIHKVIADIRKNTENKPYPDLVKYIEDTYGDFDNPEKTDIVNYGSFTVVLQSEAKKVNINTLTNTDSVAIDFLYANGLSYNQISYLIDYRDADSDKTTELYTSGGWKSSKGEETKSKVKNASFSTTEEIKLVNGIGETTYENIKDYITVCKPIKRGGLLASYYKGLLGSSPNVVINKDRFLNTIIELGQLQLYSYGEAMPGTDKDMAWRETRDADFAGSYLFSQHPEWGNWELDNFGVIYRGYIDILPTEMGSPIKFLLNGFNGMKLYIDDELVINKWNDAWTGGETGVIGNHTFKYAGWHPIRIEFYANLEDDSQALELQWKNSGDAFDHNKCIPSERLGYEPPMRNDYYSEGFYKITSTGRIMSPDGSSNILAEKKISAAVKLFGAWTQTTRSEFSAPWTSATYSEGGINWVTWLDSCPVKNDFLVGSVMSWDGSDYQKTPDSLKLGFWDNFDEDVAYSVVNVKGLSDTAPASYEQIKNVYTADDSDNEFNIFCEAKQDKIALINGYYYSSSPGGNIFARTWEQDYGELSPGSNQWGYSASQRKDPVQPVANWCAGYFSVKLSEGNTYYNVYQSDGDDNLFGKDFFQIYHTGTWYPYDDTIPYVKKEKVLGFTAQSGYLQAYLDGDYKANVGGAEAESPDKITDVIYMSNQNHYQTSNPMVTTKEGALSRSEAHFDNIRAIPEKGFLVSTAFFTGPGKVQWEKVSWNGGKGSADLAAKTDIEIYIRTSPKDYRESVDYMHKAFPADAEAGFAKQNNNSQIIGATDNDKWIQYKAVLKTSAVTTGNYSGSSVTPVLEDVTITYLPTVETFYWREEAD